jgi:hypothetical protein
MDDRYYRSACSVIVVSTGDFRSATTFQGIRNYNIVRTYMTIMVFTIFLLRYSIRCSEALLNPMTRHFVIRHTKYDPCKLHPCAQQQQQTRASIPHDSFSRKLHNHANDDDSSNSLLLDDLLNEVLKCRPKNDAAVDSTTTTSTLMSSQQTASRTVDSNDKNGWRCIDWATTSIATCTTTTTTTTPTSLPPPPPSPVDIVMVRDRLVYFKRDDQVR